MSYEELRKIYKRLEVSESEHLTHWNAYDYKSLYKHDVKILLDEVYRLNNILDATKEVTYEPRKTI